MSPREDSPPLILQVTARGIVPASAIDAEVLAGLRFGSDLQAKVLRTAPSGPLRAWWGLMGAVVKAEPQWISARALSNALLLKIGLYESELLIGGGERRDPMSLRDFTDTELRRLILAAEHIIQTDIIPGVDIQALLDNAKRG